MIEEESNKELEDWCDGFCKDFDRSCEEYDRRMKENGLLYGTIFDNEKYDLLLNYSRASFKLKKEDLKEYVYVDKLVIVKRVVWMNISTELINLSVWKVNVVPYFIETTKKWKIYKDS